MTFGPYLKVLDPERGVEILEGDESVDEEGSDEEADDDDDDGDGGGKKFDAIPFLKY